jgi:RNA polymerase sigma-70 factor (ECF subfamily)
MAYVTERWLSPLFLGDLEPGARARHEAIAEADLEDSLTRAFDSGRAAWPGIDVDVTRYVRHLASVLDDETTLESLHTNDLYLACACLDGNAAALATLERDFIGTLAPALRSTGLDAAATDDVTQKVREMVLVGSEGVPGIANYRGRGQLRSWLRAVALRNAMMEFRGRREAPLADDALSQMPAVADDAQLAPWKAQYAAAFRKAFAEAITTLDERDRTLLRQHHLDRLSIDALASLHKVHRATAARWVASAREALLAAIRKRMIQLLAISGSELDSALRMARSQLDVSIHRLFDGKRRRGS